jgi:cell pole-organizing protein PopZ
VNEASMNKPATKEPSMDEILSSIRQIIADDDASAAPPAARPVPTAAPVPPRASEPLALSPAQMIPTRPAPQAPTPALPVHEASPPVPEAPPARDDFSALLDEFGASEPAAADPAAAALGDGEPELVDPEDVAFAAEVSAEPEPPPSAEVATPPVQAAPPPRFTASPIRPAAPVAQAAPMPDPTLSADMAEQLLAPATDAAVQGAMARLGSVANTGLGAMTVEAMIRDLLRPMLKDWLDENLPALVERMVEKEIARISRGVK